jgi:hypothetical protein
MHEKARLLAQCWRLAPDFVGEAQEALLLKEAERVLAGLPWNKDHFDAVIHNYRETSVSSLDRLPALKELFGHRIRPLFEQHQRRPMPVHVLELAPGGCIKAHVDNPEVL